MKLPRSRNMLRNEAARWVARLQSGRDPRTEERFRKWVERSPAHAEAFDRISRSYSRAGLLRESALVDRRAPAAGERPRTPRYALAAAASVAVIVSGVAVLGSGRGRDQPGSEWHHEHGCGFYQVSLDSGALAGG